MVAEIGEFKGHKTITLKNEVTDKFGFCFGLSKAKLIVKEYEAIKKFVEEVEKKGNMGDVAI